MPHAALRWMTHAVIWAGSSRRSRRPSSRRPPRRVRATRSLRSSSSSQVDGSRPLAALGCARAAAHRLPPGKWHSSTVRALCRPSLGPQPLCRALHVFDGLSAQADHCQELLGRETTRFLLDCCSISTIISSSTPSNASRPSRRPSFFLSPIHTSCKQ